MDLSQLQIALSKRFEDYNKVSIRRIIFWYDTEKNFVDLISQLDIPDVKIHCLTGSNYFATKRLLELEDTHSNYLIYAPFAHPRNEDDWLLNTFLYSEEFSADKTSLVMNELGLSGPSLKEYIKANITFFDNEERWCRLQAIPHTGWDQESLELAMMASACKLKTGTLEGIIKTLFICEYNQEENEPWCQIGKWPGHERFWFHVKREYGYDSVQPTLHKFLLAVLISCLEHNLPGAALPASWGAFRLRQRANGVVFVDHWMNSREDSKVYDDIAVNIDKELNLQRLITGWEVDQYIECDTFPIFDQAIVLHILNSLQNGSQEYKKYQDLLGIRKTKHWYEQYRDIYAALSHALDLLALNTEYPSGFPQKSSYDTFLAYSREYYQLDQAYRCFYEAFDRITDLEIMKNLQSIVENLYTNGYLHKIAFVWSELVGEELVDHWPIPAIPQQRKFYHDFIQPILNRDREKVYVIISDAFHYEAAAELAFCLNQEVIGSAILSAMQGVIPSYTKLGMASLLPGKELQIKEDGRVLVDGKETETLEQRRAILQAAYLESTAIGLQEFISMSKDQGRELARSHRLIYIYHNVIDATGDKQASEHRVFEAVRQTMDDIQRCIRYIINQIGGTSIYITADHGFLYQREALVESDKVAKEKLEEIDSNRRFVLTTDKPNNGGLLAIDLKYILGSETKLNAVVPKGIHRYKTQGGGTAYVHGGASLQEIVIPLIQYKNLRASKLKELPQKVDLKLTNTIRKITNNTFTLDFFQTDRISEKRQPRRLRVVMMDLQDGERKISDEKIIIVDKESERAEERLFRVRLILKGGQYDKNKDYYLCLFDEEDELNPEYERIPFTINLGIMNDFDDFN